MLQRLPRLAGVGPPAHASPNGVETVPQSASNELFFGWLIRPGGAAQIELSGDRCRTTYCNASAGSSQRLPDSKHQGLSYRMLGRPMRRLARGPRSPQDKTLTASNGPADEGASGPRDHGLDSRYDTRCDHHNGLVAPCDCQLISDITAGAHVPAEPWLSPRASERKRCMHTSDFAASPATSGRIFVPPHCRGSHVHFGWHAHRIPLVSCARIPNSEF